MSPKGKLAKAKDVKAKKLVSLEELVAQRPYFHRLSSGAQRLLLAQYRAAAGALVSPRPAKPKSLIVPAKMASPFTIPANIRVNNPAEDAGAGNQTTQSEPSLAVSDSNVVVGFNDSSFAPDYSGYSVSGNGGATFQDQGGLVGNQSGDPVLAADSPGNFYYATLSTDGAGNSSIGVAKSTNGGVTFTAPVNASTTANGPGFFQDKEWLTVDNTGEDNDGNLYVAWTLFGGAGEQILFARSTDGGATFSAPLALSALGNPQGAMPAVDPDGNVFVTWLDRGASQILIRRSTDGGASFTNPVTGGGAVQNLSQIPGIMNGNIRADSFPSIAIDQDDGQIYVAYASRLGADQANVYLTVSTDQGQNWSGPVLVNDDGTTTDQWMPSVAVTEDGIVGVMFYDRRNDPVNNLNIDVYLALSTDHGKTIRPNQRITTTSFPPAVNFDPVIAFDYMGDYNQMVCRDERFYMVWGDNRDTVGARHDPNVYFAVYDT